VRHAWSDFVANVRSPLQTTAVTFTVTPLRGDGTAFSRPLYAHGTGPFAIPDRALLLLSPKRLTSLSDDERRLTLLHECIHLDFAFGAHRARWQEIRDWVRSADRELMSVVTSDGERLSYLHRRKDVTFTLMRLPDEIVAEQCLKNEYPEWFSRRAEYYVRMRGLYIPAILTPAG
jgi:hypothetical protein